MSRLTSERGRWARRRPAPSRYPAALGLAALLLTLLVAPQATGQAEPAEQAGLLRLPPIGRNVVSTDDTTALVVNPATLAFLPGEELRWQGVYMDNDARVTVHWLHRVGALLTTLYLLFLVFRLFNSGHTRFAGWLLLVLAVQISFGISNVVFHEG